MCGNDDDPTMDLSADFGPDPGLKAPASHAGHIVADELEVPEDQILHDLPARTAPPMAGRSPSGTATRVATGRRARRASDTGPDAK